MKVAILATEIKPQATDVRHDLVHFLKEKNVEIVADVTDSSEELSSDTVKASIQASDLIVSIGGDGSMLRLIHRLGIPRPPVVGVNLGSLGFLADVPVHDLFGSFDAICRGSYTASERLVLEGFNQGKKIGFAVNEISVHRGCYHHLVDLAIHEDGTFVNTFSADGVLVSTPSGSTAYSLSAGGPILTPEIQAIVITPICPHTISNRPIVLMPKHSITIELWRGGTSIDMSFDGQVPISLMQGELLEIRKSEQPFRLVTLLSSDYFSTLRTKLGWAGSLRRSI